jgi:ribosome-associated protein
MMDDFDSVDKSLRPSKTQLKREMTELQTLGLKLLQLNKQQLKKLELPEGLADAVTLGQRISKQEAKRRQAQYIGRLMRDLDEDMLAKIKRYLEAMNR